MYLGIACSHHRQKIVPMTHSLDQHKRAIQHHRNNGDEGQLTAAVNRPHGGRGVVWQHQGQHRNRSQGGQGGRHPKLAEALFAMSLATHQQTNAHHTVENDHDRSNHGVTRQPGRRLPGGHHHRDDQRHLNGSD